MIDFIRNMKIDPKIYEASLKLYNSNKFYHEIFLSVNLKRDDKKVPTMGVNYSFHGPNLYYNQEFVDKLTVKELTFILIHEIYHLLFKHPQRTTGRDHFISNIAQDMIINTCIQRYLSEYHVMKRLNIYDKEGKLIDKDNILFVPPEFKDKEIYEILYEWIMKNTEPKEEEKQNDEKDDKKSGNKPNKSGPEKPSTSGKQKQKGKGAGEQKEEPFSKDTQETMDNIRDYRAQKKAIEDAIEQGLGFDSHLEDEVPEDLRNQMVGDLIEGARRRGHISGNDENLLNDLRKSKKNYLREIKRDIMGMVGQVKYDTWTRPNRRDLPFKGYKKFKSVINVIWDTSGSMSGSHEKAISYIYQNEIAINLIQCDTEVKDVEQIKSKKEFRKLTIKGNGGTTLQPAVDLVRKKYNKHPTLVLTDGFTDTLDFKGLFKRVLILSVERECPLANKHGNVKQIIIEEDYK